MSLPKLTEPIPVVPRQRTESMMSSDSDVLTATPPQRRFSLSGMLGRRTSVSEAYQKYSGFTINGDGFKHENYIRTVEVPVEPTREKHNQEYFLP